ncbi:hypothetical protein Q5752_006808 [Cryptotrichosporon argae]
MTDMRVPPIIYGTAWKKERTAALVYAALRAGFRGIDTACQPKHYREDLVGAGLKQALDEGIVRRADVFIQTKFTSLDGQDATQTLPYAPTSPVSSQVVSSLRTSLRHLGLDYIDAVVLHAPLRTRVQTLEAWRALEAAVRARTVRRIGVSNCYDVDELEWLAAQATVGIQVVQNRWYEGNGWDWDVVDWCLARGVTYQSFWTLTGSPSLLAHPALGAVAARLETTREAALYRVVQAWGITPLCGSTAPAHVSEALRVGALELDPEHADVQELRRWTRGE